MRLLSLLIVATAFGSAGCTQDTALGDPLTTAPASAPGSLPPVGHGGPLDHQTHPAAVSGSSAGMAGDDAANGTLSRPITADENTGFAPDAVLPDADDAPSAQSDGAPIAAGGGDTASTERDRQLNQRIRLALAGDRSLAAAVTRLRLGTVDGVVTLQGQVATSDSKERLEQAVSAQEGVKKVQNHVAVGAQ